MEYIRPDVSALLEDIDEAQAEEAEEAEQSERRQLVADVPDGVRYKVTRSMHEFVTSIAVQGGLDASVAWTIQGHVASRGTAGHVHQRLVVTDDLGNPVHQPELRGGEKVVGLDNMSDVVHPEIFAHLREAMHILQNRLGRSVNLAECMDPKRSSLFERLAANRMRMSSVLSGHQYLLDKTHDRLNLQSKRIIDALLQTFPDAPRRRKRLRARSPLRV